ncbi:MAG: hypothetical protein WAO02_11145 [Verrucomicrobiia bacterium]
MSQKTFSESFSETFSMPSLPARDLAGAGMAVAHCIASAVVNVQWLKYFAPPALASAELR